MKIQVRYEGGESRYNPENGIDYMLAVIPESILTDEQKEAMESLDMVYPGRGYSNMRYELYAEVDPIDYCEAAGLTADELEALYEKGDEAPEAVNNATFAALKSMILEQAREIGVPAGALNFV